MSLREGESDDGLRVLNETQVIIAWSLTLSVGMMHRRMYLMMELGLGGNHYRAMEELTDGRAAEHGADRWR